MHVNFSIHALQPMDEEAIIKERVIKPETAFKRLQRLCQSLLDGNPESVPFGTLRTQVDTEFESFDTRLTKMGLEVAMSQREISRYQEQKKQCISSIEKLDKKSEELQQRLEQAQFNRSQKEECNALVNDMTKAKRVMVPDPSGNGEMIPIIGLLNSSRAEDMKLNESLREEIASLESQRDVLQAQWDGKKQQVVRLLEFVERFKEDIIKKEEVYTAESERRRNDEIDEVQLEEVEDEKEEEKEEKENGDKPYSHDSQYDEESVDRDYTSDRDISQTPAETPNEDVEMVDITDT